MDKYKNKENAEAYGAVCISDSFLFDFQMKLAFQGRINDILNKGDENREDRYEAVGLFISREKIRFLRNCQRGNIKLKPN